MSAIADDGPVKPIEVLFAVHDDFDTLDVLGPLEIFHHAKQDGKDGESPSNSPQSHIETRPLSLDVVTSTRQLTRLPHSQGSTSLQDHHRLSDPRRQVHPRRRHQGRHGP